MALRTKQLIHLIPIPKTTVLDLFKNPYVTNELILHGQHDHNHPNSTLSRNSSQSFLLVKGTGITLTSNSQRLHCITFDFPTPHMASTKKTNFMLRLRPNQKFNFPNYNLYF